MFSIQDLPGGGGEGEDFGEIMAGEEGQEEMESWPVFFCNSVMDFFHFFPPFLLSLSISLSMLMLLRMEARKEDRRNRLNKIPL